MSVFETHITAEIRSLSPYGPTRSTIAATPIGAEERRNIETQWRARNYLSLGMIYLQENPLLVEALRPEHIKNRLRGHWGSSPGLSFIHVHLSRIIEKYDLDMIFSRTWSWSAPGHLQLSWVSATDS